MEWLLWVSPSVTYVITSGAIYRHQYIKTFKTYRRWQANDPRKEESYRDYDSYHSFLRPRAETQFWDYVNYKSPDMHPGWWGVGWPVILIFRGLKKLLHPEVEVPDYEAIKKLERACLEKELEHDAES